MRKREMLTNQYTKRSYPVTVHYPATESICRYCGKPMATLREGVTHHIADRPGFFDDIDYTADRDHTAIEEIRHGN